MKQIIDQAKRLSARDTKTLSQKALKLCEEAGELAKAVLPFEGADACNHRFPSRDKIVEECADVFLVAYSIVKNLEVSDEDLLDVIQRKADYWERLQDVERQTDLASLHFEVHITVESTSDIETFQADCQSLGVKPIILDLYTGGEPILDVMTSSHFRGTTRQAAAYSRGLVSSLEAMGYRVLREKIETVPWHPASKQAHVSPKASQYFEAHLAFPGDTDRSLLDPFLERHRIRLSRNKMKKGSRTVLMGTYRIPTTRMDADRFVLSVGELTREADALGIEIVERPDTEFALYDNNTVHDQGWIG